MARWVRWAYLFARPFGCGCLNSVTMLRFHIPLIKPDVRFSRIRLSDKDSCFRPREVASQLSEADQAELLAQVFVVES